MSTYFVFMNFTEQGITKVSDSPDRRDKAKEMFAEMGVTIKDQYALMGSVYDAVYIVEAPNCSTATKAALKLSTLGNVRTSTNRAYSLDEWKELVNF